MHVEGEGRWGGGWAAAAGLGQAAAVAFSFNCSCRQEQSPLLTWCCSNCCCSNCCCCCSCRSSPLLLVCCCLLHPANSSLCAEARLCSLPRRLGGYGTTRLPTEEAPERARGMANEVTHGCVPKQGWQAPQAPYPPGISAPSEALMPNKNAQMSKSA